MVKLYLPTGTRTPEGWGKTGERVVSDPFDARPERVMPRTIQAPVRFRDEIQALTHPTLHREKAIGVFVDVSGSPLFILGLGQEWTEDLKDMAEDYAAEEEKFASQRAVQVKERRTKFKERLADQLDEKLAHHKRNHRTNPLKDPRYAGKRIY